MVYITNVVRLAVPEAVLSHKEARRITSVGLSLRRKLCLWDAFSYDTLLYTTFCITASLTKNIFYNILFVPPLFVQPPSLQLPKNTIKKLKPTKIYNFLCTTPFLEPVSLKLPKYAPPPAWKVVGGQQLFFFRKMQKFLLD